jgi:hypothetical protein
MDKRTCEQKQQGMQQQVVMQLHYNQLNKAGAAKG